MAGRLTVLISYGTYQMQAFIPDLVYLAFVAGWQTKPNAHKI